VSILKSSTYKWIIGCLLGFIINLIVYLVLKENKIICISFSEAISLAATICSLILSVIAMLYTYYSGRDTEKISIQIKSTIKEVDRQVQQVSEDTRRNSETLSRMTEAMQVIIKAIDSSSEAFDTIKKEEVSEEDKRSAIEIIEKSKNSMMMFLEKMN